MASKQWYEVWKGGYAATGEYSPPTYIGRVFCDDFETACKLLTGDEFTYLNKCCRLFSTLNKANMFEDEFFDVEINNYPPISVRIDLTPDNALKDKPIFKIDYCEFTINDRMKKWIVEKQKFFNEIFHENFTF